LGRTQKFVTFWPAIYSSKTRTGNRKVEKFSILPKSGGKEKSEGKWKNEAAPDVYGIGGGGSDLLTVMSFGRCATIRYYPTTQQ
jgi:hypothetical protein